MTDDGSLPAWIISALSGIAAGFLSALGTIAWFGGGMAATSKSHDQRLTAVEEHSLVGGEVQATLKAHDQRLTTLENDIRYEIRSLRDRVEHTAANIHALRNELMTMLNRRARKSDEADT